MNPTFIIEMENGQTMKGELYPETAPNTVASFVKLVQDGFYNGPAWSISPACSPSTSATCPRSAPR